MTLADSAAWWTPNLKIATDVAEGRSLRHWNLPKPQPVRVKHREPEIALGAIKALTTMRGKIEQQLVREVAAARAAGCTWADVAAVLGTSHQAAIKKYARTDSRYAEEGPESLL